MIKANLKFSLFYCLLITTNISAQRVNDYIHPDSAIYSGVRLHDKEKYKDAIATYQKVSPSDPKYPLALIEASLSFSQLKEYDSVIAYTTACIERNDIHYLEDAFILRGSAFDNKKEFKKAQENYKEALKIFPDNIRIHHHIGISYYIEEDYQKAIDVFKEVNVKYAGYIKNQLAIAEVAAKEGHLTQAYLAYTQAALYAIGTDKGLSILADMDKLASKKYEDNPKGITISEKGDNFSEITELLKSQVALQPKYKINSEIDYPIVRQLHLLFSQLENYEPTDGYFDKYYVPYYKAVMKENYFPRLIELLCLNFNTPKVQSIIKKNSNSISKFVIWTKDNLPKTINKRDLTINGKTINLPCIFANGEKKCGEYSDEKLSGFWYYYHKNGNLEYYGEYVNDKSSGPWNFFYETGKKSAELNFEDGKKQGLYKKYYETGGLKEVGTYSMDSLEGDLTYYYEIGTVQSKGNTVNNKIDGEWKVYYANGNLKGIYNYKNDLYDGEYTEYAVDGKTILKKLNYKEGQYNGLQQTYYSNGQLEVETNYANGERSGEFKKYNKDGKLIESLINNKGKVSDHKEYYDNEKLKSISEYDNEDLISIMSYNYDGELFSKMIFKNDILKQVLYYDAIGNEIAKESIGKNDEFTSKWFYSNNKNSSGNYKKGKKHGKWEYYNINGSIQSVGNYTKGELDGIQINYDDYGRKKLEYEMKNGVKDGFWKKYHESGSLIQEGWYINDNKVGPWYDYYVDGTIMEEYYFKNDKLEGKNIEYDPDGKPDEIYNFKNDNLQSIEHQDPTGKIISKIEINKEKVSISYIAKFEYAGYKKDRIFGKTEGFIYSEPIAGIFDYKGNYVANEMHGNFIRNFKNGNKHHSTDYILGESSGGDTFFYINGNIFSTETNNLGSNTGPYYRYYYNGNKYFSRNYIDDNRVGLEVYYGLNGEEILHKNYKLGYLDFIVKNNESGELTDTIKVKNETIEFEAKYKNGTVAMKEKTVLDNLVYYQINDDKGTTLYSLESDDKGNLTKKEFFYSNGKLLSRELFNKGELNGETIYYREDGSMILSEEYKNGRYHGNVKIYDDTGQLKNHLIYRNGVAYDKIQ